MFRDDLLDSLDFRRRQYPEPPAIAGADPVGQANLPHSRWMPPDGFGSLSYCVGHAANLSQRLNRVKCGIDAGVNAASLFCREAVV